MTPQAHAALRVPRTLADTRRMHLCPRCAYYAYHRGAHGIQTPVHVGLRVHHPACSLLRPPAPPPLQPVQAPAPTMVRTGADATAEIKDGAPSPLPILFTAFGIFVATLNIAKSKGP